MIRLVVGRVVSPWSDTCVSESGRDLGPDGGRAVVGLLQPALPGDPVEQACPVAERPWVRPWRPVVLDFQAQAGVIGGGPQAQGDGRCAIAEGVPGKYDRDQHHVGDPQLVEAGEDGADVMVPTDEVRRAMDGLDEHMIDVELV